MKKKPTHWLSVDLILAAINSLPTDLGLSAVTIVTRAEDQRAIVHVPNVVLTFLAKTHLKGLRVAPSAPPLKDALSRVMGCFLTTPQVKALAHLSVHQQLTDAAIQGEITLYVHFNGEVESTVNGRRFVLNPRSNTWTEHSSPPSSG